MKLFQRPVSLTSSLTLLTQEVIAVIKMLLLTVSAVTSQEKGSDQADLQFQS